MKSSRLIVYSFVFAFAVTVACSSALPDQGPLAATSRTMVVSGKYARITLNSVERITIEGGKLVIHGDSASVTVDLPPSADPDQKNRGWALVTEGEDDDVRRLTFTHETSLDDFSIAVPASAGQMAYGTLGGRDGSDILLFAYGSGSKTYWGWARIAKPAAGGQ